MERLSDARRLGQLLLERKMLREQWALVCQLTEAEWRPIADAMTLISDEINRIQGRG